MDDEIHFRFVDGDATAPRDERIGPQTEQRVLDVAGGFSTLCEVACFDRVAQDKSRALRNNIFEKMTCTIAADFLFLIIFLQSHENTARDITLCDHSY